MKNLKEIIMKFVFLLTACVSIAAVVLICLFLFTSGIPAIAEIGPLKIFVRNNMEACKQPLRNFSDDSRVDICNGRRLDFGSTDRYTLRGILAKFCPKPLYAVIKPAVNLMAGIPSVVYGFFGLVVLVPFVRENIGGSGRGMGVLTASGLLGIDDSSDNNKRF